MCAKTGRPKSDNPKSVALSSRVTYETYQKLYNYALKHKISIAATIRKGIEKLYEDEEEK